ncbi:MAG: hypothetical protein K0S32_3226 [Bacteroidetes bacterium]|jgi:uncharacterized protein (DUF2235 family)|nr:hypothetical protein [Bacteroidota bacterium]
MTTKSSIIRNLFFISILIFFASACTQRKVNLAEGSKRRFIAVFIDGTGNRIRKKPHKNTNVVKLYNLVKKENKTFYIEGVGTRAKVLGLESGAGITKRVRDSYRFICENYNEGDSIGLFGFSRGAAACRMLSNVIFTAGILDLDSVKSSRSKNKIIKKVYRKYRGRRESLAEKRLKVAKYVTKWNTSHRSQKIKADTSGTTKIEVMGLWDTVDDVGWPSDYCEKDFDSPASNHLYQACNLKKVFHAMSLDDNRAQLYTPILMTGKNITKNCYGVNIDDIVEEVWFSGAHSQVGGYIKKSPGLSNTSLRWMTFRLKPYNLLRDTCLNETSLAPVRNMQDSRAFRIITKDKNRSIDLYYHATLKDKNGKLKVHQTVIERIEKGAAPLFKKRRDGFDWFEKCTFSKCFTFECNQVKFKPDCDCIQVVKDEN